MAHQSYWRRVINAVHLSIQTRWYQARPGWLVGLKPLEWLYRMVVQQRKRYFQRHPQAVHHPGVPVIVVGNLTLGGSGKSPVVAALAHFFKQQGYRPGIVSRGYGGQAAHYPCLVDEDTHPAQVGDEPQMLFQQLGLPIAVDPQRSRAAAYLVKQGCDLLLADDGLQHWALGRDIELLVIDGQRGLGNQHCLPLGPLREPMQRLQEVDALLIQGEVSIDLAHHLEAYMSCTWFYSLVSQGWRRGDGHWQAECPFARGEIIQALAGIGHPERFFEQLRKLDLHVIGYPLPDHAALNAQTCTELSSASWPWVMTAKDGVKLQPWLTEQHWVQEICAALPADFLTYLLHRVQHLKEEKYHE